MPQDLFPHPWLVNTLLDQGFVDQKKGELAEQSIPYDLSDWLAARFDAAHLSKGKEAQLEDKLTRKDVPATAKAQDLLRAQNDKTVARLYGITDDEFAHLLRSFKGLATKRPEYLALLQ